MPQSVRIGAPSHFRVDPLTGMAAVLVAPGRGSRPNGKPPFPVYTYGLDLPPDRLETCFFCQGNEEKTTAETGRIKTADGKWLSRSFPNIAPSLQLEARGGQERTKHPWYFRSYIYNGEGTHEVIVESPYHNACISKMKAEEIAPVFVLMTKRYNESRGFGYPYFHVWKNFGETAAASQEHSHWQFMASLFAAPDFYQKIRRFEEFAAEKRGLCPLCLLLQDRLVAQTENFRACVPLAPFDNYELLIAPKNHISNFAYQLAGEKLAAEFGGLLADAIRRVKRAIQEPVLGADWNRYSDPPHNIWINTAPYIMEIGTFHWHAQVRFLTSKDGGFEKGTGVKIITALPEDTAETLRQI